MIVRDAKIIWKTLNSCIRLKRIGQFSLLVSSKEVLPFSFWIPFQSFIVVPQSLVENPNNLRMVVAHEMQHHRQNDTKWVYLLHAMRGLFFWNPFVHLLEKTTSELQEFACDESLFGLQWSSSQAYCDCLLWVAQKRMQNRYRLVGTASFIGGATASLLKRRIESMLYKSNKSPKKFALLAVACTATLACGIVAHATSSFLQDQRITREKADEMAAMAASESGFPIVVNDLVLEQLNRYLGTPDGCEFMRLSISRMKAYESTVTSSLNKYRLPLELAAIPIVESGYKNLPGDQNPGHGAGIWMFIASTARNFGLQINDNGDERLDLRIETDAAMRLLASLNLRLNDWGLAVMSYNIGANGVQRGIDNTGSRDPWTLVKNGFENDKGYLASVIAAALILKNPSSVD